MKPFHKLILLLSAALLLAMPAACSRLAADDPPDDGRLRVVTTTAQVGDIAKNVGGEHVVVTSLMVALAGHPQTALFGCWAGLAWALVAVSAAVVFLGVLVTGSGPHSGDASSENRFFFDPRTISWLHADVVLLFLGLTIGLLVALTVVHAPGPALRRTWLLLIIAGTQGALGYVQYFTDLPVVLVTIHVLGAGLVWIAVLFIPAALRTRGATTAERAAGISMTADV